MSKPPTDVLLHTLFEYGVDFRSRRVFMQNEMETDPNPDEAPIDRVVRGLLLLDHVKDQPIELWINSPGGDVDQMFGLYDVVTGLQNRITTVGFGAVCSAAGLILAAGDHRISTENCSFMAHEFQTGSGGTSLPIVCDDDRHRFTLWQFDHWFTLIARHTRHTKKWWMEHVKGRELWMKPHEMKRAGVVDEIRPRTE